MWEQTLPSIEENLQTQPETADVGKYFHSITENGTQYLKCVMKNCGRRLGGDRIGTMETHMNVAHNMNFLSTSTGSVDKSTNSIVFGDAIDGLVNQVEQNLSESADVRKYFQLITEDSKQYSKCLIKNCMRRISGNHLNNLKRHLKAVHDANSNPWSSEEDDALDNGTQVEGECVTENDDTAKVRQHFRIIIEDSKLYSKCLLRGCKRRLAGNHLHNLKRHLNHGHNMKVDLKPKKNSSTGPRRFFQRVDFNGRTFSKCLIKDCGTRLAGDHCLNLARHLETEHDIKSFFASTESLSDDEQMDDESNQQQTNGECIEGDAFQASENATNKLNSLLAIETFDESIVENTLLMCKDARKYFQCITENGKSYSRCLIKNCSRRIDGISKEKLTRHLCLAHKMSSEIEDARTFFKCEITDDKIFSVCLIQNCSRRIVGDHLNNLKKHLRGAHDMIIKPSCREMKSEMEDARKYFESFTENGKMYSRCLIDDCDCRIAGNHLWNLKRHLTKHNININSVTTDVRNGSESDGTNRKNDNMASEGSASAIVNTCRLCFEKKENAIDIFSTSRNIAKVLHIHFPANEVSRSDPLPKFVCSTCWVTLSNFHKFYLSVNKARDNFFAKSIENITSKTSKNSSKTNFISCKLEPNDTDELSNDDKEVQDERNDESDFANGFCKVFLPDCDIKMQVADELPQRQDMKYSEPVNSMPELASRDKMAARRKSERNDHGDSRKRPADSSDTDLICEFCGKPFSSYNAAQIHYAREHSNPDGDFRSSKKRVKR